jgi:hypothetical protein
MNFKTLIRKPSAFIPIAMSCCALAIVLIHIAIYGAAREADEGTAAHLFQLLMTSQVFIVTFFAIKWLPKASRSALLVLILQCIAAVAALGPVFLLGL